MAGCQNVDANGRPKAGATLTVYNGGALQLSSVYQDIGLAVPGQNPMIADQTGRLPFFYVADGTYRARLVDASGILIYDYPQLASIGASSSGGGGSAVDPAAFFQTGDSIWQSVSIGRAGWVRQNGLTIGSAVSGASERANADCQNLFLFLWNNYPDGACPVVGGRGASAAADWAANKQITLPDMRGRGPLGCDGMGNARANILPDGNVSSNITGAGDTGDTAAAYGGEANHILVVGEMPAHNHAADGLMIGGSQSFDDVEIYNGNGVNGTSPGPEAPVINSQTLTVNGNNFSVNGSVADTGGDDAHNNVQPFILGIWYIRL